MWKMKKINVVQAWLDNVAYSHSKSESTKANYTYQINLFCQLIGKTPEHILEEYERTTDREFRRKYARYLRAFISDLNRNGYAVNTVKTKVAAIKSFFKYNDLPLGYVPVAKNKITFHNRDIAREEVKKILEVSRPRDKAFFFVMAQSGLRPDTLCKLRLKHIEHEFSKGIIPCKIEVPEEITKGEFGGYFTFMGEESVKYLKIYLATRSKIDLQDYLFTSHGTEKQLNPKSISNIFKTTIEKLKEKGMIEFEQKQERKPRTVRLYNLRKYFRKEAGKAGVEYVNFWMGHKTNYQAPHIPESDEHYFSREDVEFHRKLYEEKAMPHLRLETPTPSQTDKIITRQAQEIQRLKEQLKKWEPSLERLEKMDEFKRRLEARVNKRLKEMEVALKESERNGRA